MKETIVNWIREYSEATNTKGYVIGISGGKDSTVVAKLLCDAVGSEKVLGVLMPNGEQKDIKDSIEVCNLLGIDYQVVNIHDSYLNIISQIENNVEVLYPGDDGSFSAKTNKDHEYWVSKESKINIAPRLRMITLYTIAQSLGYRVCGTGNRSERYVGYTTKWGDSAADINPIAGLTCSDVIKLGDELGLPHHLVHKIPSDGLTGMSDEEKFGFTYDQLDRYITQEPTDDVPDEVIRLIDEKHKKSTHKNGVYAPIINNCGHLLDTDYVSVLDELLYGEGAGIF